MARTKQKGKRKQPPRKSTVTAYKCLTCAKPYKDAETLLVHGLKDKHLSEETLQILMQEAEKHRVTKSEEGEGNEEEASSKKMKVDEEQEDAGVDTSADTSGDVSASVDEESKEGSMKVGEEVVIESSSSSSSSSADIASTGLAVEESKEGTVKGDEEVVIESSSSSSADIASTGLAVEESKEGTKEGGEGIEVPSKNMEIVKDDAALQKEQGAAVSSTDVENREENVEGALGKEQEGEEEKGSKKMEVEEEEAVAVVMETPQK